MYILKSIIYGLVSGIAEFLPISARAHQGLLRFLFGMDTRDPLLDLLVHMGLLISVFVCCREYISQLHNEQKRLSIRRRRSRSVSSKFYYDLRLLKTATIPLLVGLLLYFSTAKFESSLLTLMLFLICNAFVLLLAEHSSHGNRDSGTMSGLDGILLGVTGALSVFPGISRTGMIASYATLRGADGQNTANWAALLAIPALIFSGVFDVVFAAQYGLGAISVGRIASSILAGIASFFGGYLGVSVLKVMLTHGGFSKFAYYSIGAGLFSFILYLIT